MPPPAPRSRRRKTKAREAATARAVAAKDAQIETLTMEVRRLRHEVETARETASRATMGAARAAASGWCARAPNAVTSHDGDGRRRPTRRRAAYVLGETGGGVDPGVRSKNENENNDRVRDRGREPTTDVGSAMSTRLARGRRRRRRRRVGSQSVTSDARRVDFFGGGAADAGRSEMTPAETTLGANAAAAADALLKARGTGECSAREVALEQYLTESGRRTAVSQRAMKFIFFHTRGAIDDRRRRPARKSRSSGPKIGQITSLAAIGFFCGCASVERFPVPVNMWCIVASTGRRRRARRHHRSRHRMRRHGEDLRLPDEDGDGKRQTPLALYLRALHPVRCVYLGALAELVRGAPARAPATTPLPPPPGVAAPIDRVVVVRRYASDDAPEHGVGALRDIREGFVVGGGCPYTLRTRGRRFPARAASEDGPTVMRLATARGRARRSCARKRRRSGPIRTAGRTAHFSD